MFHHEGTERVWSDKKLLKNIIINLISNAIKFSNEGQPLEITSRITSEDMQLVIKDKGIGISGEDLEHLYSSFYRGKNAVNIQGTGLGLHIVKRYVDLLNGTIELDSILGQGTTFSITIPSLKQ